MKWFVRVGFSSLIAIFPALMSDTARPAISTEAKPSLHQQDIKDVKYVEQLLDQGDVAGAIDLIEQKWKDQYEAYYQGRLTIQLINADAISQRLATLQRQTQKRAALVYLVPTLNHLEVMIIPSGAKPIHHRLKMASQKNLLAAVKSFKENIATPSSSRSRYLLPAQQLYSLMIQPLEQTLKTYEIDTLIFCLGDGLRTVPLAALHDGHQFLIEKYNLAIIPAFNLLDARPVSFKDAKVLAMGASEFQAQPPLPAVPMELQAIATNPWSGEVLLNQNFTIKNLRTYRDRQRYQIVHLATHADFAPGSAQNSYIQFWDQRLSPNRFMELRLNVPAVELLVLSACRTAVGDPQAELGFAGLAVMSGSRAAIASLWAVSDEGTMALMTEFYRQLKTVNKTEALRQAQIAMLKHGTQEGQLVHNKLSHPYFWAAFTMIGNAW